MFSSSSHVEPYVCQILLDSDKKCMNYMGLNIDKMLILIVTLQFSLKGHKMFNFLIAFFSRFLRL